MARYFAGRRPTHRYWTGGHSSPAALRIISLRISRRMMMLVYWLLGARGRRHLIMTLICCRRRCRWQRVTIWLRLLLVNVVRQFYAGTHMIHFRCLLWIDLVLGWRLRWPRAHIRRMHRVAASSNAWFIDRLLNWRQLMNLRLRSHVTTIWITDILISQIPLGM